LVIDLEKPEAESVRVLPGETMGEARSGGNFQVVEDDDSAGGRLVQGEKQGMLALRRIRRAIHEDELRLLQSQERFALRRDIEGFDRPETIPAPGQRHDAGEIGVAFWKRAFQLLGAIQPIRGIFYTRGACGSPPQ